MKFKLSLLGLIIPFLLGLLQPMSGQDPDGLISARLFSDASEIKPGDSIWIGVEIDVEEGWHVYWKTAGDTGFPTEVEWTADDGVQIAPALYPAPYFYEYQGSASYAYKGKILLLSQLTLPAEGSSLPSNLTIQGELSALVCNESNCLPYKKELNLELPVGEKTELVPSLVQEISESLNSLPIPPSEGARISGIAKGDTIGIEVQSPDVEKLAVEGFDFFAEGDFFDHAFRPKFEKTDDEF